MKTLYSYFCLDFQNILLVLHFLVYFVSLEVEPSELVLALVEDWELLLIRTY
jgi:hypothetical protein